MSFKDSFDDPRLRTWTMPGLVTYYTRLEDAVLFAQERDDVVLLMAKLTAQCRDQELERKHVRSLR